METVFNKTGFRTGAKRRIRQAGGVSVFLLRLGPSAPIRHAALSDEAAAVAAPDGMRGMGVTTPEMMQRTVSEAGR